MEGEWDTEVAARAVIENFLNSGSQTMAFVMALQQGWSPTTLKFQGTRFINADSSSS